VAEPAGRSRYEQLVTRKCQCVPCGCGTWMKALQTPQLASASMMLRRKVTFFAALLTFSLPPVTFGVPDCHVSRPKPLCSSNYRSNKKLPRAPRVLHLAWFKIVKKQQLMYK